MSIWENGDVSDELGTLAGDTRTAARARAPTTLRVFGGVGVDEAEQQVGVGGSRQQRLLALFLIRHGQVLSIDWLAEYLWGDDERPDAYATRLRTYISRLRQALPADAQQWIDTEHGGYRLSAPDDALEHVRFLQLRSAARDARDRDDPLTARQLLDDALALWRGEPFRELEDLDWARADVEQLRLDRLEMREERWEAELALGRHTQITGELDAFVREQPLRERGVRQYALALHRCGRTAEALRVIRSFRSELADETGLDPPAGIIELEASILAGDPALGAQPAGQPLRGYRLLEEVGAGAFAIVWRGVQPSIDRDVAVKQVRAELATRPEFIRRFEAEARLVARIEHPYIVPLIDYWRDPDSAYLVMRWLGGGTLERRLDDGPLSAAETLRLAETIGGALSAAHRHGVVHRDVKPSNILLDDAGNAYLTDFGIALDAVELDAPAATLSHGSPTYAAPEQLRGEASIPQSDVFSLGVVLYECLSGTTPFHGASTADEALDRQLHEPFPPLEYVVEGIAPGLSAAVARATMKEPGDRFATIEAFVDALRSAVADRTTPALPTPDAGEVDNPYVGLRAFDDGDADRFFGRARLVDEIVGRMSGDGVRSRCVVVVGPSGSGKSSVVRAGVVPTLRRGAVLGSSQWYTTTMVPGGDPYESLEAALLRIAVNPPTSLIAQLRDGPRGIVRGVRRCLPSDDDRVVLVVDQLEELFTASSSADADAFLEALAVAIDDPSSPLRLVATLRADYYDRPLRHASFAPIVKAAAVEITPLAPDEMVDAIAEPAQRAGVSFEPGLVARIAAEALGQPSPLPLLQFVLSELFDRRRAGASLTIAEYDALGGLAGALATRAESLYGEAEPSQREAVRSVFGRLTDPSGAAADIRRRVTIADLGQDDATHWVLDRFGAARLLTFDRDATSREPTVEVAHEALLREWPRAADWLDEDRHLRRTVDSIGHAADEWAQGGRQPGDLHRGGRLETALEVAASHDEWLRPVDREFIEASATAADAERRTEQRRLRRLRRLVTGTAIALVVALSAAGIAIDRQSRADRQAQVAEGAADDAELATLVARSAAMAPTQPGPAILLALEARQRSPGPVTDRALLDAIAAGGLGRQIAAVERLEDSDCRRSGSQALPARRISHDGLREFAVVGEELLAKDLRTGETTGHGTAPRPCTAWFEDASTGRRWAGSLTAATDHWTASAGTSWTHVWSSPYADSWWTGRTNALGQRISGSLLHDEVVDDRLLYWNDLPFPNAPPNVLKPRSSTPIGVVDASSLDPVGASSEALLFDPFEFDSYPATASSTAAGLFAVGGSAAGGDGATGLILVLHAATGGEAFTSPWPSPVTALAFDVERDALLVGDRDGRITVVDLADGQPGAELRSDSPSPIIAFGVRPDGTVVAVGEQHVEVIVPDADRAGTPFPIAAAAEARVRPDGTVVVAPVDQPDTLVVVDPRGGPIVDEGWSVDPDAVVAFGAGRAAAVTPGGEIEVIDLENGSRSALDLSLPNDERFEATGVLPDDRGFLAWDDGHVVGRWTDDGELVEQVDLRSRPGITRLTAGDPDGAPGVADAAVGPGAATVFLNGFPVGIYRIDTTPGATAVVNVLESPPSAAITATVAPDDGLHVALSDGTLRTYDRAGARVGEIATGLEGLRIAITDTTTGGVALGGDSGAVIIDPTTGAMQRVAEVRDVVSVGFARGGTLLVVVEADGAVRLWDRAAGEMVGTLWSGDDRPVAALPWYDESTDSVWVATSGSVMRFSLDPDVWAERACALVARELTAAEWDQLVPGDVAPRPACA